MGALCGYIWQPWDSQGEVCLTAGSGKRCESLGTGHYHLLTRQHPWWEEVDKDGCCTES